MPASIPFPPDGKSDVATGSDGKLDIYPVEPGEPRAVPGADSADVMLRWAADGNSIFVYKPSPRRCASRSSTPDGSATLWKEIRPADPSGVDQVGPIQIAPDDASYVYSYRRQLDDLFLVGAGLK